MHSRNKKESMKASEKPQVNTMPQEQAGARSWHHENKQVPGASTTKTALGEDRQASCLTTWTPCTSGKCKNRQA